MHRMSNRNGSSLDSFEQKVSVNGLLPGDNSDVPRGDEVFWDAIFEREKMKHDQFVCDVILAAWHRFSCGLKSLW